ncbi:hypothetical protein BH11ACT4_BH11ACT4_17960 [soil metagenome]
MIEAVLAMTLVVVLVALVDPAPGLLVLGAVLAMTLSRSRLVDSWRGRLESVVVLPVIGLLTAGVAALLAAQPIIGAIAFTAAMFLSVWLRRFGPTWRRIGSLVALPFTTLLIAPVQPGSVAAWQAALVSLVALVVVVAVRMLGALVWHREVAAPEEPGPPGTMRPSPSTRMASQLAAAVAAAFVLGFWLFPQHWAWVVLTAYLVSSGNRGRADVLYKSGLRVLGAAAGSLAAFALVGVHLEGPPLVAVVIGAVAIGLVLRSLSYAFWALIVTLALTVLQAGLGAQPVELWPRVLAIVVGAACGVLASWVILPIRSEGVLRKRIAAVLAALDAMVTDGMPRPALTPIDEVAPPFVALTRAPFAPERWRRAGEWVLLLRQIAPREIPQAALPELRAARKSLREPAEIAPALRALLARLP